jgi:hypothetical protein
MKDSTKIGWLDMLSNLLDYVVQILLVFVIWNSLISSKFGLPELGILEAGLLFCLCQTLFGSNKIQNDIRRELEKLNSKYKT